MKSEKVRIRKRFGGWVASILDADFAIGISPRDAYLNLEMHLIAQGRTAFVRRHFPRARAASANI
jgi:hypothetical protein